MSDERVTETREPSVDRARVLRAPALAILALIVLVIGVGIGAWAWGAMHPPASSETLSVRGGPDVVVAVRDLARRGDDLESEARREAERTLQTSAIEAGILDRARANAASTVEALVRSLGYADVVVTFRDAE